MSVGCWFICKRIVANVFLSSKLQSLNISPNEKKKFDEYISKFSFSLNVHFIHFLNSQFLMFN